MGGERERGEEEEDKVGIKKKRVHVDLKQGENISLLTNSANYLGSLTESFEFKRIINYNTSILSESECN